MRGSYKVNTERDERKFDEVWHQAKVWIDLLLEKKWGEAQAIYEQNLLAQDLYGHIYCFDAIHDLLWFREIRARLRKNLHGDLACRRWPKELEALRNKKRELLNFHRSARHLREKYEEQLVTV